MDEDDENIIKALLHRLIIDTEVLRLVAAHLIVQRCRGVDDPTQALRALHKALDAAANLAIEGDKSPNLQQLVEEYQPRIDQLITLCAKLLSVGEE